MSQNTEGTILTTANQGHGQVDSAVDQNNQGTQEGQNNQQTEGSPSPGWLSGVSAEYRDKIGSEYKTVTDFAKEALAWKEKASQPMPEKPGEGATAAEVEAYRKTMGIPVDTAGYEIERSEFIDDSGDADLRKAFLDANLDSIQAKAIYALIADKAKQGIAAIEKANKDAHEKAERALKEQLQGDYEKTVADAGKAFARFGTQADIEYLNKTGLGNDPGIIMMFARIQNAIGGDSVIPGQGPAGPQLSEAKARFPNSPMMHG